MLSRDHALTQAEILAYAKDQGVPIVDVQPACYMENFTGMMLPRKVSISSFSPRTAVFILRSLADRNKFV
jgi:hypothetical protein